MPPRSVIAKGWDRPMPPNPAVKNISPFEFAREVLLGNFPSVSKVPSTTPWDPMYSHGPAVYEE